MSGELERFIIAQDTAATRGINRQSIRPLLPVYDRLRVATGTVELILDGVSQGVWTCVPTNAYYGRQALWMAGGAPAVPGYIAVGTGVSTDVKRSNTALSTELFRKAITSASVVGLYTVRFVADYLAGEANGTLTEAGLFDAAAGPYLFARSVVDAVKSGEVMQIVWDLVLTT